jgi:RHS repeat-associated protein
MQGAGGVGGMLSESSPITSNPITFNSSYPTYDGNGNVSEYLDSTGQVIAHFEYDPFGNTVVNTDTGNQFTYRFSTKPTAFETGLYYYGYRYYDPMTGRWPSRDPIEESGGINLYAFVYNDGIYIIDKNGENPLYRALLLKIAERAAKKTAEKAVKEATEKAAKEAAKKAAKEAAKKAKDALKKECDALKQSQKEDQIQLDNGRKLAEQLRKEGREPNPHGLGDEIENVIPKRIQDRQNRLDELERSMGGM